LARRETISSSIAGLFWVAGIAANLAFVGGLGKGYAV
jgi:hypothetical protein